VAQSTLQLNLVVRESMLAGRGVPVALPVPPGVPRLSLGRAVAWQGAVAGRQTHLSGVGAIIPA